MTTLSQAAASPLPSIHWSAPCFNLLVYLDQLPVLLAQIFSGCSVSLSDGCNYDRHAGQLTWA